MKLAVYFLVAVYPYHFWSILRCDRSSFQLMAQDLRTRCCNVLWWLSLLAALVCRGAVQRIHSDDLRFHHVGRCRLQNVEFLLVWGQPKGLESLGQHFHRERWIHLFYPFRFYIHRVLCLQLRISIRTLKMLGELFFNLSSKFDCIFFYCSVN